MARTKKTEEAKEIKKTQKKDFIFAVGRRREAVARVRLYPTIKEPIAWDSQEIKKGELFVNKKPIEQYFSGEVAKATYQEPLRTTNTLGVYTATIQVAGGGVSSQLDAVVLGISRALAFYDKEKFRPILKKKGYLIRDARVRQRRKVGMGGKSRRKKQSPKR